MRTFSVELAAQPGALDNFTGTYEECVAWCEENEYENWCEENETGARICEIEIDEDGCWTYCYAEHEEWKDAA